MFFGDLVFLVLRGESWLSVLNSRVLKRGRNKKDDMHSTDVPEQPDVHAPKS